MPANAEPPRPLWARNTCDRRHAHLVYRELNHRHAPRAEHVGEVPPETASVWSHQEDRIGHLWEAMGDHVAERSANRAVTREGHMTAFARARG